MGRNRLALKGAATEYWYLQPKFATREDAEEACKLLNGLCDNKPLVVHEKKVTRYSDTIGGKTLLEAFAIPNRSYHVEDIQAHMEERHHSASTVLSYLPQLVREGVIYKVGQQTYAKRHKPDDPTSSIRADVELEASGDGNIARLELSEAGGDRCGDEGHSSQDPGHRC